MQAAAMPPPPPAVAVEVVSVPPPSHATEPEPPAEVAEAPTVAAPVAPAPRRTPRQRPSQKPPTSTPAVTTAAAAPPAMELGQLTTGGETNNAALRQATEDLVRAQGRRLTALPTATAASHAEQVERARLFLRQADDALKKLDVEGARTLATKVKVILDEIAK